MILPGISGAFIPLLLAKYQYIMQAVGDLNIPVIVIFVVGAAAGIISFSHLLSWLLKHWHDVTVAVLMGFMVGSLNKVWPWKETAETYLDSHGVAQPLVQHNVAPGTFEQLTGQPSQLVQAVLLCVVGFLAIYGIELLARIIVKKRRSNPCDADFGTDSLGHSASAAYFTEKFNREGISDCEYSLYELGSIGDLPGLLERLPELCGLNVTIPSQARRNGLLFGVARGRGHRGRQLHPPHGGRASRGPQH